MGPCDVASNEDYCPSDIAGVRPGPFRQEGSAGRELDAGFDEASKASWKSTADVRRRYATASVISAERIVFNIKGNGYRLVVAMDFEKGIVWIKWIGTHKAYDKIDVAEVRYGN
jgi:mRNA interferase HigB